MIGGGKRVTLRIVAKHAYYWNIWAGPQVLAHKGKIHDDHCADWIVIPRPSGLCKHCAFEGPSPFLA